MQHVAIIPAAGVGKRFGGPQPKQYTTVAGIPVLVHTIRVFQRCGLIDGIVVAVSKEYRETLEALVEDYALNKVRDILIGGSERQDSVAAALQSPTARTADIVLVHDAVRPCVSDELVLRVISAAQHFDAAVPGITPSDTIKEIDADGFVLRTPPRSGLRAVQTPQGFKRSLLQSALAHVRSRGIRVTDDASAVEAFGHRVVLIDGETDNIKLTTRSDHERITQYLAAAASRRPAH